MSDRKYRHRGYQDDDRDREPRPKRTDDRGRPFTDGAPRGRGLGAPTAVAFKCAVCGHSVTDNKVSFDTPCPSCGKPLRTCRLMDSLSCYRRVDYPRRDGPGI